VTIATAFAADYSIPFFTPLDGGKGVFFGWLQAFDPVCEPCWDIRETSSCWLLPTNNNQIYMASCGYYYEDEPEVFGSLYVPLGQETNTLGWTNATLCIGNLDQDSATAELTYSPEKNAFTVCGENPNEIQISLYLPTGLVSGSFVPTGARRTVSFKGMLLPSAQNAQGIFHTAEGFDGFLLENEY
jgi:hypothetical protein